LYFAEAYASLDKLKYPGEWARLLNEYAYVFYKLDRMEDSLRTYEESDAFPEQLSSTVVATSLYLRSGILRRSDRHKEALEIARRALAIEDKDDYRLAVAKPLVKLGDFRAAIEVLDPISPPLSDKWSEFEYYENMATASFQLGEFSKTAGFLKEVMASKHSREVEEESIYGYKRMLAISLFEVGEKEESGSLLRELMIDPLASSEHRTEYTEYISQIGG
jgi:tetratricopeptide (TPR) repeat protein